MDKQVEEEYCVTLLYKYFLNMEFRVNNTFVLHLYLYSPTHCFQDGSLYHVLSQKCVQAIENTDNGIPVPSLQPCSGSLHQKWFFEERR